MHTHLCWKHFRISVNVLPFSLYLSLSHTHTHTHAQTHTLSLSHSLSLLWQEQLLQFCRCINTVYHSPHHLTRRLAIRKDIMLQMLKRIFSFDGKKRIFSFDGKLSDSFIFHEIQKARQRRRLKLARKYKSIWKTSLQRKYLLNLLK